MRRNSINNLRCWWDTFVPLHLRCRTLGAYKEAPEINRGRGDKYFSGYSVVAARRFNNTAREKQKKKTKCNIHTTPVCQVCQHERAGYR